MLNLLLGRIAALSSDSCIHVSIVRLGLHFSYIMGLLSSKCNACALDAACSFSRKMIVLIAGHFVLVKLKDPFVRMQGKET